MHGRRHRQAVRQCFVCRIGRQIGVQIDAAGQAKAQRAFARNTCACRATSRCWGICVLARCALPSENLCAGKLACKICNSQIRLLPHHGISGSRLGLALAFLVLVGDLLSSLVRNIEIRPEHLVCNTSKADGCSGLLLVFSNASRQLSREIRNRIGGLTYCYYACFFRGAPGRYRTEPDSSGASHWHPTPVDS